MKKVITLGVVLTLFGCASTPVDWSATGGSRSDGSVKLSYEYGLFGKPEANDAQGLAVASERCQAWGYQSAEAFGGVTTVCQSRGDYGCNSTLVTKEYQCLGDLER